MRRRKVAIAGFGASGREIAGRLARRRRHAERYGRDGRLTAIRRSERRYRSPGDPRGAET